MKELTKISFIGKQGQGKTMFSCCLYCGLIDNSVVIMFHVPNCPKKPNIDEVNEI